MMCDKDKKRYALLQKKKTIKDELIQIRYLILETGESRAIINL